MIILRLIGSVLFAGIVKWAPTDALAPASRPTAPAVSLPTTQSAEAKVQLEWLNDLSAAKQDALKNKRPILVRSGATWCGWCKKLDRELSDADLAKELTEWTLSYLDVDRSRREASSLNIGPIPALRILAPTGRTIASRDGFVEARELLEWLKKHRDRESVELDLELTQTGKPELPVVGQMIGEFRTKDAALREAAIRRLLPHPEIAAPLVVDALRKTDLATRLAALELLQQWKAPLEDLDPWRPETVSPARLERLRQWAEKAVSNKTPGEPTPPRGVHEFEREIETFLNTDDGPQGLAARERLARHRDAVLPEVYERLKHATTDEQRERLTELRYRLVASDQLALDWTGGLARLASRNAKVRHEAAEELARRAADTDGPLVLELFSDPDPIVRELSLRALKAVRGPAGQALLAQLLNDPDANVRAAVLKQLAQKPPAALVAKVIEYIKTEKDPDLVVYGVRVLRQSSIDASMEYLTELLNHAVWQVRAEAAEALGERLQHSYKIKDPIKSRAYSGLLQRLDDEDGFVVGRALAALQSGEMASMVTPERIRTLRTKHSELAVEAARLLAGQSKSAMETNESSGFYNSLIGSRTKDTEKLDLLRELCADSNPAVRSVAITGLCEASPVRAKEVLATALADSESQVRCSTAAGLLHILSAKRPKKQKYRELAPRFDEMAEIVGQMWQRLLQYEQVVRLLDRIPTTQRGALALRDGDQSEEGAARNDRPPWMVDLIEPLEKMLSAPNAEERIRAAVPLFALGSESTALPVLLSTVRSDPKVTGAASAVFCWMDPYRRSDLAETLTKFATDPDQVRGIVESLSQCRDSLAAETLWRLLDRADIKTEMAGTLKQALVEVYFGDDYWDESKRPKKLTKKIVGVAKNKAREGDIKRRSVALAMLVETAPDDAADLAENIFTDPETPGGLRGEAFRVMMLATTKKKGAKAALGALGDADKSVRKRAAGYLATGGESLQWDMESGIHINSRMMRDLYSHYFTSSGKRMPIEVKPVDGLTTEAIRPLLADEDHETRGYGGYLLATLGEGDGLDVLLDQWRQETRGDGQWRRLAWKAVAALKDDSRTPLLEEIYRSFESEDYNISEFYWTIRSMSGPKVEKLRKTIRHEVGMARLK